MTVSPDAVLNDMIGYARCVARRMMPLDPEWESIAVHAAWKAAQSYGKGGRFPPVQRWVAYVTKRWVWDYQRRVGNRPERTADPELWTRFSCWDPGLVELLAKVPPQLGLSPLEWKVLWEKRVDKWPWDVVARRNGMLVREARELVASAEEKARAYV